MGNMSEMLELVMLYSRERPREVHKNQMELTTDLVLRPRPSHSHT